MVEEAIPGLPAVKVQDLHYGDVLFYFYKNDHFDALVRLAAYRDQGHLTAHARDAELGSTFRSVSTARRRRFSSAFWLTRQLRRRSATKPGSISARYSTPPVSSRNRSAHYARIPGRCPPSSMQSAGCCSRRA
jgi:hypothetical protein